MDTTQGDTQQINVRAIQNRASDARQSRGYSPKTSRRRAITNEASAEDVPDLLAALAAERDRADRAWSAAIDRAREELVRHDQFSFRTLNILDDVRKEATA